MGFQRRRRRFIRSGMFGLNPIAALFAQGANGLWLDTLPKYLFEDSAGTISDVVNGDPTGLALDRHAGLTLGPELVSNGTFDSDISGWSAGDPESLLSHQTGRLRVENGINDTSVAYALEPTFSPEIGKWYEIRFDVISISGAGKNARVLLGGNDTGTSLGVGQHRRIWQASSTSALALSNGDMTANGGYVEWDNISVRELPGNHATQPTSADRPTYNTDGSLHWLKGNGSNWHLNLGQALNLEQFTVVVAIKEGSVGGRVVGNRGTGTLGSLAGWQIKGRNLTSDQAVIDDGAGNYIKWDHDSSKSQGDISILTLRYRPNDGLFRMDGMAKTPAEVVGNMGSILTPIDGNLFTASNSIGTQSFSGEFFSGVVTSDFLSIAEIAEIEKEIAKKAGITL